MKEKDLDEAAELIVKNPYYNPRPIEKKEIRQLLENAFYGQRPERLKAFLSK
jgi:Alcohol dehydrogenase, class IV